MRHCDTDLADVTSMASREQAYTKEREVTTRLEPRTLLPPKHTHTYTHSAVAFSAPSHPDMEPARKWIAGEGGRAYAALAAVTSQISGANRLEGSHFHVKTCVLKHFDLAVN